MSWRLITVTRTLVARCGKLRCRLCSRKLKVGEEVWSHLTIGCRRYNGASHHTRHYCKECYKKLWCEKKMTFASQEIADERLVDIRKLEGCAWRGIH